MYIYISPFVYARDNVSKSAIGLEARLFLTIFVSLTLVSRMPIFKFLAF